MLAHMRNVWILNFKVRYFHASKISWVKEDDLLNLLKGVEIGAVLSFLAYKLPVKNIYFFRFMVSYHSQDASVGGESGLKHMVRACTRVGARKFR